MKKLLLAGCALLFIISCKKDITTGSQTGLSGKWELRLVDGGYSAQHTEYAPGNGNTLTFSGNNQYSRTDIGNGDTTNCSGTYTLTQEVTCYSSNITFIKFSDNGIENGSILDVSGDTLNLLNNPCIISDGVNFKYARLK